MALPDHMKIRRKKVYTERLTLHLDQPTMKALLKGFEVFRENYSTFSEYVRCILIEYIRSPYFARFVK